MASSLRIGRSGAVDMTTGSVAGHLITFAIPLLLGNLFQQFYNMVDTWVVGNYVGNEAFSAVGSVTPIVNMLIGFFTGLANGAGVVISQYYGAKRYDDVRRTVQTSALLTLFLGVLFTAAGLWMTPHLLHMMKTPPEVFPQSMAYLNIYFAGIIGLMIYNMGAGILRAVGDSNRPFYYLVICAVLNILLDLFFVLVLHLGVRGVALATILAQSVSAVLVVLSLLRTKSCVRLSLSAMKLHGDVLKKVIRIGFPAAIQVSVTQFSNIFVQSYINFFGADCMSGWTAYLKLDQLLFLPMQSLGLASTTFVGQNLGDHQVQRAKQGVRTACLLAMGITALLIVVLILPAAPYLVAFFNDKPAVVQYGTLFLRYLSPFYILCAINQVYMAALRGSGNSKAPMIIMLLSFVLFRQVYLFVMANFISNTVLPISMAYPAGWLLCSLLMVLYYHHVGLDKHTVLEK